MMTATGHGLNWIFKPGGGYYRLQVRIDLRASRLWQMQLHWAARVHGTIGSCPVAAGRPIGPMDIMVVRERDLQANHLTGHDAAQFSAILRARSPVSSLKVVRRAVTISMIVLWCVPLLAVAARATSGHRWRTLTIHQAWTATVTGARRVAKQAESSPHAYGPSRPSSVEVPPQSACRRHSRYQVDCPFVYFLGDSSLEVYTRCTDTGQVREVAEQRFRFTSQAPRCHLIYNKTH